MECGHKVEYPTDVGVAVGQVPVIIGANPTQ